MKIHNTFEYKMEKYGWSLEDFEEYNKSRAATLEIGRASCRERVSSPV